MNRKLIMVCVFVLLMVVFPAAAQARQPAQTETPSWCPVEVEAEELPEKFVEVVIDGETVEALPSDDGELVAYVDMDGLWVAAADGSDPVAMVTDAMLQAMRDPKEDIPFVIGIHDFAWIPGTRTIVFNTDQTPQVDGLYLFIADDLWTIDTESGDVTALLPQGEGGEFVLSPDGAYAVVMQPETLLLHTFDTGETVDVTMEGYQAFGFGEYLDYPQIVWAEDAFYTFTATDPYRQHDAEVTVWRVAVEGDAEQLGTFTAAYVSFAISPDAELVTYWNTPEEFSNERTLYVATLDGEETFTIFEGGLINSGQWTPDSRHFTYTMESDETPLTANVCEPLS